MEPNSENLNYWKLKWMNGEHKWHKDEPNHYLVEYYDKIVSGRNGCTFLLPLCGKSLDLLWLYNKGHFVIGIEGVQKPVMELYEENNIEHTVEKIDEGSIFQSTDKRLKIFVGDFFSFTGNIVGKVDCVWVRGSLVAIQKRDMQKYADLMKTYLRSGTRYLLQTVE